MAESVKMLDASGISKPGQNGNRAVTVTLRGRNALLLAASCRYQHVMVRFAVQRRAANVGVEAVKADLAARRIAALSQ